MADFGDKVSEADKSAIEVAIADLKTALEGEDLDAINAKSEALTQASMKLGEAMYAAQQSDEEAQAAADAAADAAKDEDIVDADFEEVRDDDEKKS